MSDSLEQLNRQIRACSLCLTQQANFSGVVQPTFQIASSAKILIVGQAPGLRTLSSGKPFDDLSGIRLRDWLGVTETQFYDPNLFAIVPMAFCYPGKGTQGDLPPPLLCTNTWHVKLFNEMQTTALTIYLGKYACRYYLGANKLLTDHIKDFRSLLPTCIALPHPSPRNRFWLKQNPWFDTDLLPELRKVVAKVSS